MQSRKKNLVIAAVVAGVLSLPPAPSPLRITSSRCSVRMSITPCPIHPAATRRSKSVTPTTFEDTIMLYYLCEDNRVIARRFFRMGDGSQMPKPVFLVPAPGSQPAALTSPLPTSTCPIGFVGATSGGCVPRITRSQLDRFSFPGFSPEARQGARHR